MKTLTRTLVAAVAASFLFAPIANAQSRHYDDRRPGHHQFQKPAFQKPGIHKPRVQMHKIERPKHGYHSPARHHWSKGQRVHDWKRKAHVRDYKRHGLRTPGRGQQWIKVDNDYLLIGIASGVIAGIIAGR